MLLVLSLILAPRSIVWMIVLIGQLVFYALALIGHFTKTENRFFRLITYYAMTVVAQWNGVFNIITGKAKPTWSKAESTR